MHKPLPDASWRQRPGLDQLLAALGESNARFVGGAVRDGLLGLPVSDIDIATPLAPQQVIERLSPAIRTVPTGIDHGTVTAILDGAPIEITTLRRDVATDGRRATIAYTDDWREDAARRDFTINALYADPASGEISDYFGGLADLEAGRVRFIGDPSARIAEDHLRILRYFRFHARFGKGAPDVQSYAACRAAANSLMALSRERIADELLKLLALPDPSSAVGLMIEGGIFKPVLPEIDTDGLNRLALLVGREAQAGMPNAPIRRLAALLPPEPALGESIGARLKLSNKARRRLTLALAQDGAAARPRVLAFRIGVEGAQDRILLDRAAPVADLDLLRDWTPPALPISGGALIARGLAPGPDIARALNAVQEQWLAEDFPDRQRVEAIADQIAWKFQRARQ
ncbi:MAG: CCA tRNA nucleotidyltransferase [Sphingobium sp.]